MKNRWIFILLLSIGITACEDINRRNPVPIVPVDYTLYVSSQFPNFMVDNGFQTMTITQKKYEYEFIGYAGLLIWIGMDGNYHAADLCCPFCLNPKKPVEVDGIYAICPKCDEHFDLSYGFAFPTKGITPDPLRQYSVRETLGSTGLELHIRN